MDQAETQEENAVKQLHTKQRLFYLHAKKKANTSTGISLFWKTDGMYTNNEKERCDIPRK